MGDARREASADLVSTAEALIAVWTDPSRATEALTDRAVVVVRCGVSCWDPTWFAQQGASLSGLVRRRRRAAPRVEYDETRVLAVPWDADLGPVGDPWARMVALGRDGPIDVDTTEEEQARDAEDAETWRLIEDVVGALNCELERRGTEQVVVMVDEDGRPTRAIDRWWPPEVRTALRRRLR